jgi:hypothetical protein
VLQARERIPTPYPSIVFTFRLAVESIKEFGKVEIGHLCFQVAKTTFFEGLQWAIQTL